MLYDDAVISVRNLKKSYRIFSNSGDRIKQAMTLGLRKYHREFTAIDDISFDIRRGETIGIIGRNGSGKSTLLQLICGILKPSSGAIMVNGRVSALLELGAGFNPEFTGRENVYFQGALMGLTKNDMDARFDDIEALSDIGQFIDQPVQTYSSGMFVRLAFAVAIHLDPDILVVDEALSVGDIEFQAKGKQKMQEKIEAGCTLILVSHDIGTIKSICNRAFHLDHGKLIAHGESGAICDEYVSELLLGDKSPRQPSDNTRRIRRSGGTGAARVLAVDMDLESEQECFYGKNINIRVRFQAQSALNKLVISFYIKNSQLLEVLGTSTEYEGVQIEPMDAGQVGCIEFKFRNPLRSDSYSVTVILADDAYDTRQYYDWVEHACLFKSYDIPGQTRWAFTCPEISVNYSDPPIGR